MSNRMAAEQGDAKRPGQLGVIYVKGWRDKRLRFRLICGSTSASAELGK